MAPTSSAQEQSAPTPLTWKHRTHARWLRWRWGDDSAWAQAVSFRNLTLARALAEQGVSAKEVPTYTIMLAVDYGDPVFLSMLLENGANPNAKNDSNYCETVLHRAVVRGNWRAAELLLAAGADIDSMEGNGYTPLAVALNGFGERVAAWEDRRSIALSLLKAGANPTKWVWNDRQSVLDLAPLDVEVLDELIKHGANPTALVNPSPHTSFPALSSESLLVFRASEISSLSEIDEFLKAMERHGQGPASRGRSGQPLIFSMVRSWNASSSTAGTPTQAWSRLLELMEARGHDLTARDSSGNTVWHVWAQHASSHFSWVADAFFAHPVLATLASEKNSVGQTPLDLLLERTDWLASSPGARKYIARLEGSRLEQALPQASEVPPVPSPRRRF